jgi:hypothetical protein
MGKARAIAFDIGKNTVTLSGVSFPMGFSKNLSILHLRQRLAQVRRKRAPFCALGLVTSWRDSALPVEATCGRSGQI